MTNNTAYVLFHIFHLSIGIERFGAREDARRVMHAIRSLHVDGYSFTIKNFIESSHNSVTIIIVAQPDTITTEPISIWRVRNLLEAVIRTANGLVSVQPVNAKRGERPAGGTYFSVWPTSPRGRALTAEQLGKLDPEQEIRKALDAAQQFAADARQTRSEVLEKARIAGQAYASFVASPPTSDVIDALNRTLAWTSAHTESQKLLEEAGLILDHIEASVSEIETCVQEVVDLFSNLTLNTTAYVNEPVPETGLGLRELVTQASRDGVACLERAASKRDDLAASANRCTTIAREERATLRSLVQARLAEQFGSIRAAHEHATTGKEELERIVRVIKEASTIVGSDRQAEPDRNRNTAELDQVLQEVLFVQSELTHNFVLIDVQFNHVYAIYNDPISDGITIGEVVKEWLRSHILYNESNSIHTTQATEATKTQHAQLEQISTDGEAAKTHVVIASDALDQVKIAVARAPWVLPKAASLPTATAARLDTLMDNIRWFLNERGNGTWTQMKNTIEMVLEAEDGISKLRAEQIARRLRVLGYVESDFGRKIWSVTPPVLSLLRARSSGQERVMGLFGQVDPQMIEQLCSFAKVEWVPQPDHDGPRTITVTCQTDTDLAEVLAPFGVEVADSGARLAEALPMVDTYMQTLVRVDDAFNFDLVETALLRDGRSWVASPLHRASPGFWKLAFDGNSGTETHDLFRDPITNYWFRGEREVMETRLALGSLSRTNSVQYTLSNENGVPALRVRQEWRWPALYERAAVLSSGGLPSLRGSVLEYEHVPPDIAKRLCEKMMVELTIGAEAT